MSPGSQHIRPSEDRMWNISHPSQAVRSSSGLSGHFFRAVIIRLHAPVHRKWIDRHKLDIMILQKRLKRKPVATGRLAANYDLFHFGLIHEFLCPSEKCEESHPGVAEPEYPVGEFKSPPVKSSAEVCLGAHINTYN